MTSGITQTLFAQSLAKDTGLTFTAALAWAEAEVGSLNNLGIMSNGKPVAFPSPAAGAAAAAALIKSSPLYAGIVASVGKGIQAQLDAIARSPWHLGPTGLQAAGGVDPYYAGVFASFGYVAGSSGGGSFASPPATSTGTGASSGSTAASGETLATYLGLPASQPLTVALINSFTARAAKETGEQAGDLFAYYIDYVGQGYTLGTIPAPGVSFTTTTYGGAPRSPSPVDALLGSFDWVPTAAVGLAVLGAILVLGYSGLEDLLR